MPTATRATARAGWSPARWAAQRLTRTEYDGTITVLADRFEGKRLTGPNDVVVKSDGSIWFSDNGAGIRGNYLGHKAHAGDAVPRLSHRPGKPAS